MSPNRFVSKDSIAIFTFPLPSPTNYALLANLVTILSHVYARVIVITGGLIKHIHEVIDEIAHSNNVYIYDIGLKLPLRDYKSPLIVKVFTYVKIQVKFLFAALKFRSEFETALFFIGIPHMFFILLILRLLKKKIVVY